VGGSDDISLLTSSGPFFMDYYGPTQNDFIFTLFCPFIMPFFLLDCMQLVTFPNWLLLKRWNV